MSSVNTVLTFIEAQIETVLTSIRKAPHFYNIGDNDTVTINHSYAIRPGDASPTDGTIGYATYEQDFSIEITRSYADVRANDLALRAAIELLYVDHQLITKQLALRKSAPILVVGVPSKGAPSIDEKNKFVSITFNYPIKYRELIREV